MKKILAVVGILALAAVIAVPVMAQGPGYGRGRQMQGYRGSDPGACPRYGWGIGNLTDEQRDQMDALHQKFYDQTAQVRSQIWAKKAELNVLMNTSNPDLEKACSTIVSECSSAAKISGFSKVSIGIFHLLFPFFQ